MKVIDLSDRVLFSDDIIEIYKEDYYYYVKTKNGDECIDEKDYYKIKDYLLSLNEDTPKEDKKIEKLNEYVDIGSFTNQIGIEDNLGFVHWSNDLKEGLDKQTNFNKNVLYKINEIIDKINGDSNE